MSFKWDRMYKWEQNIERDITDSVYEYVCEYYGIDDVGDLTQEQYREVEAYAEEYSFSIMSIGFSNLLNDWLEQKEE